MCVSSDIWHRQIDALTHPRYTLLMLDNRASGASSSPNHGYDMHTMARDMWAIVDTVFGRHSRVHLVGHSMGAMIAQRAALVAARRGDMSTRIASLSLLSGHDGGWFWNSVPTAELVRAAFDLARAGFCERVTAEVHLRLHYTARFLDERQRDHVTGEKTSRRRKYFQRYLEGIQRDRKMEGREEAFWQHLAAVRSHALSEEEADKLDKAEFPKLVVYGRDDPVVLPRASCELAKRIGAQAVAVKGAHFIVDEAADEVNELLRLQFERSWRKNEGDIGGKGKGGGYMDVVSMWTGEEKMLVKGKEHWM